jgi:cytochrome c biogenesis protein CcdA
MVAEKGNLVWGIMLLLLYSVGHSVLIMIAGTSVGFVRKLSASEKYGRFNKIFKIVMGSIILLLAFYMFYLGF